MANKLQGGVVSFLNNVYEVASYAFRTQIVGIGGERATVTGGRLDVSAEQIPTEGNNPSIVLGYTGDNLTTITKTIGATSYVKTLTYSGSVLTNVSVWVQQ